MRPVGPNVQLFGLPGIPQVRAGDDLAQLILEALERAGLTLQPGDVLVVTQKIVSKAEGCAIRLDEVTPSVQAVELARASDKDPRLVEVILQQSRAIIRQRQGTLITETHHGWICANAGVDRSNVAGPEGDIALTLPRDPDASAERLRSSLAAATGVEVAVLISDTHGRPWRLGTVNVTLGAAGIRPITDLRGRTDWVGYTLHVTTVARADELAAAAGLVMGQADEGIPVVLIRGAEFTGGPGRATDLQRPVDKDLFR